MVAQSVGPYYKGRIMPTVFTVAIVGINVGIVTHTFYLHT